MSSIFVSHASDDKDDFVRPLAHALKRQGLKVWYDEFSLRPGDSLRRSIDRGLAECAAGLVVLSPAFFAKEWPQRELDALFSSEIAGRSRILPIWYNIDRNAVLRVSPLLADRLALQAHVGVEAIALKISEEFPPPAKVSGDALARLIERYEYPGDFGGEALNTGCQHRFLQMNAFKEENEAIVEKAFTERFDPQLGDFPEEAARWLEGEEERLRIKHRIPDDVYLVPDEPIRQSGLGSYLNDLCVWVSGTLTRDESAKLVYDLDMDELDEYYILLEVPNFTISGQQRDLLQKALIEIGCGYEDDYKTVAKLCETLRSLDGEG
jgi:hypothetical protein